MKLELWIYMSVKVSDESVEIFKINLSSQKKKNMKS